MHKTLALLSCLIILFSNSSNAQTTDARIPFLAEKILEKIPELKCTADILGRHEQRPIMATKHATAIVAAADKYAARWNAMAAEAGWKHFDAHTDLPALLAAIAHRESSFRSVVRNDDNSTQTVIPADLMTAKRKVDAGVMQVRVPSDPARRCGVITQRDINKLIGNLDFAYEIGACVLTNRLAYYIPKYNSVKTQRLQYGLRPDKDLRFFGVFGDRVNTAQAQLVRELVVIERYNWGDADLYNKGIGAGYARRVLTLFEYFRFSELKT